LKKKWHVRELDNILVMWSALCCESNKCFGKK